MKIEEALAYLNEKGYKTTGKREYILKQLAKEDRFLSAKELQTEMKQDFASISFDTIYKNLGLFKDLGIIEETEIQGERQYRFCSTHLHHHHFICTSCGTTEMMENCPLSSPLQLPKGYAVTGHKFEVYGLCPACK